MSFGIVKYTVHLMLQVSGRKDITQCLVYQRFYWLNPDTASDDTFTIDRNKCFFKPSDSPIGGRNVVSFLDNMTIEFLKCETP